MSCSRKIAIFLIIVSMGMSMMLAPQFVGAASVKSTGVLELILNQEQTLIFGEEYEYTLELTNLDACDKELSTDFSCIPTIAVNIKQIDVNTKEIVDTYPLEHMNFGVHDLNILLDDVTIISLNVVNIAVSYNKAKVEVAYKTEAVETNILDISARDNINANKSSGYIAEIKLSNNSDETMVTTLRVDETASAQYVVIDNKDYRKNEEYTLTIQPGEMTVSISFVPLAEGHQWLSVTIDNVQKSIPVLVHSQTSASTTAGYVDKSSLMEMLEDERIIYDIRLDSAYLLGFSFILLIFGGVLGFIVSGSTAPPKVED